eukprot:CAMPEP_0114989586 /NCGR_PEP_ID=MMETSP0216-20121206/10282_1 /TAXON_ID=223996 /ORGANISM="Protocruzia adherens, Strain Boccale" /LENGTH=187 /DNA_ID=CAMNT_0002352585 /DNA_START=21 /DNA_END=584 /DNA_ORIENTATION=+
MEDAKPNRFLLRNKEKSDMNQYWFSPKTIQKLISEIQGTGHKKVAFISTPSLYFSIPKDDEELKSNSKVLEFDKGFAKDPNFVFYDFNEPENVPEELKHSFEMVVIDPPFITRDVWSKYATTAKLLMKPDAKALLCSIEENADMLKELMGVQKCAFKPSIPNLIYQYTFYCNYEATVMNEANEEIPE